ncbi:MAG: hypothetical protein HGB18_00190 [Candidatus Moranbacteria bacterium]|nr:hypothetical protein [Candidatus Moranbacteria bacterium]
MLNLSLKSGDFVTAVDAFVRQHFFRFTSVLILTLRLILVLADDTGWGIAWLRAWHVASMTLLVLAVAAFVAHDMMRSSWPSDFRGYKKAWLKVYALSGLVFAGWLAEGVGYEVAWLFQLIAMTGILFSPLLVGPMLFARIGDPRQGMIVGR